MNARRLEQRTRLAVLSVAAVVLVGLGNGAYRASSLCLADGSWKASDDYKLAALKRVAAVDFPRPVGPVVRAARGKTDAQMRALIAADPSAVVLGKEGYSEYVAPTFEDWLSGAKSKVVSIRRTATPGGNNTYFYVPSDNCGRPSPVVLG